MPFFFLIYVFDLQENHNNLYHNFFQWYDGPMAKHSKIVLNRLIKKLKAFKGDWEAKKKKKWKEFMGHFACFKDFQCNAFRDFMQVLGLCIMISIMK